MKKLLPWIGGILIGVVLSCLVGGILLFVSFFDSIAEDQPDPVYELVATSWGTPVGSPDLWIYQVQVMTRDQDKDGVLEVTAKACIGSSSYYHDFGTLGTAADMGEAVRRFGQINWESDTVTIGGSSGTVASVKRSQLEKYR